MKKIHALMIMSLFLLPSCKKGSTIPETPSDMEYPSDYIKMMDLNDVQNAEYCKRFPDYKTMETYVKNDFQDRTTKQYCAMDFDSPESSETHLSQYWLSKNQIGSNPADYHFYSEEIDYVDLTPMYRTDKFEGRQNVRMQFISEPIPKTTMLFPYQTDICITDKISHDGYTWEYHGEISVASNKKSSSNPTGYDSLLVGYISCTFFNVQSDSAEEYIKKHLQERYIWINLLPTGKMIDADDSEKVKNSSFD